MEKINCSDVNDCETCPAVNCRIRKAPQMEKCKDCAHQYICCNPDYCYKEEK